MTSDRDVISWARGQAHGASLAGLPTDHIERLRRLADLAEKGAEDARLAAAIEAERAKGLSRTLQDFGDLRERRAAEEAGLTMKADRPTEAIAREHAGWDRMFAAGYKAAREHAAERLEHAAERWRTAPLFDLADVSHPVAVVLEAHAKALRPVTP